MLLVFFFPVSASIVVLLLLVRIKLVRIVKRLGYRFARGEDRFVLRECGGHGRGTLRRGIRLGFSDSLPNWRRLRRE